MAIIGPSLQRSGATSPELELVGGYRRLQGILYQKGDARFEGHSLDEAITVALTAPDCLMVNRNAGSGTRILTDRLLNGARPAGYWCVTLATARQQAKITQGRSRSEGLFLLKTVCREFQCTAVLRNGAHDIFRCPRLNLRLDFERDFDG